MVEINGAEAGLVTPVIQDATIDIRLSAVGEDAVMEIEGLPEYHSTIKLALDDWGDVCPSSVAVNCELVSGSDD